MTTPTSKITRVVYSTRHKTFYVFMSKRIVEVVTDTNMPRWSDLFALVVDWPMNLSGTLETYTTPKGRQ